MTKIYCAKKSEAYVSFERVPHNGYYIVYLYDHCGNLIDKIMTDTYQMAVEYRKSFIKIANTFRG